MYSSYQSFCHHICIKQKEITGLKRLKLCVRYLVFICEDSLCVIRLNANVSPLISGL